MSEVLIRVVDKVNADPYLDAQCLKRGDVVAIMPDGHAWGNEELRNPEWRILKMPNVPFDTVKAFLGPELNTDPANPSRVLQRRAFRLDWASLPAATRNWFADDSRATPARNAASMTAAQLLALKVAKAPLQDPNVIG